MKILPSELKDKSKPSAGVIIHTHTEDGREQVKISSDAIAHLLGRYVVEQYPEIGWRGAVDIDLTSDENDDPLVVITEASL